MFKTIRTGVNKLKRALVILFALFALAMQPNVAIAQTASNALDFIYIDEPTLFLGDSQHIAFALSDEDQTITEAVLTYSINGKTKTTHASSLAGNAALFEFEVAESGTYQLDKLTCKSNNNTQSIDLVNGFNNTCTFSVSEKTDEASTLRSTPEVTDAGSSFYFIDETGASSSSQALESTLDQLAIGSPKIGSRSLTTDGQLVIALDPGHGGSDPGACANGLQEKDLNLKIALYCKAALEQYPGIKVVMIRDTDTTVKGLDNRVNYAVSNGADVLISFHINSASAGASGAEVWYPNDSSWKYDEAHVQGGQLAQNILDKLTDLGLTDRGIKTRDWADSHYADGSVADYYGILRYARQQGIPGIIVEHAFITNSGDASKLAQDSWLKAMGEADAAGIAETYGLRTNGSWTQLADGSWQYSIDGVVQTGWYMVYGIWYWSDSNGIMATGWRTINGNTYYLDPTTPKAGAMRRGWAQIDGKWYYFSPASGAMVTGWKLIDGTWYYFDGSGAMLTGWQLVGGAWYYMDASGAVRTGWILDGPTWYYLDPSGQMTTGWQLVGGSWYYMDGSGAMRTGTAWDGSAWSSFDASGRWLGYLSGWQLIDGTWYWLDAGVPAKGWRLLGGSWYLLDSGSGAMLTGWQFVNGAWYYMDASGAMRTGWILDGPTWYYTNASGAMLTGWQFIAGNWCYMDASGAMRTGWILDGPTWYYTNASGAMLTGWQFIAGNWYYMDASGAMRTGWQLVGGSWYYMDGSGAMRTGTAWDGSAWSSFDASGRWLGYLSGWQLIDGTWYWLDAGVPAKGWRLLGGSWYLLDSGSGAMLTGWQQVGSSWHYMNNSGAMLTGWQLIDGSYHYFDGSGAWNPSSSQPLQPIMSAVNSPSDSMVQSMAAVYNSTGHVYPSTDLASGGASSIEEFCTILVQEAADEGINPYLLFCQVMKETAWLQFGGQVSIGQFNFGGLGAVDGGGQGASFPDVRTGLRAQVQHLKAYAVSGLTESGLTHPCVDPRFKYVSKGSAQYIQWLGIQENPNHTGWASAPQYGISIVQMMEQYF